MNKSFKKYGKVSFQSRLPRRDKLRRAIRTAMCVGIMAAGMAKVRAISAYAPASAEKTLAVADAVHKTRLAMVDVMRVKA